MVSLDLRWLPLRRCWQWLALALRLEALALSDESFFFLLCLPVVDIVVLLFATAGHRLAGDLILTLLSGLKCDSQPPQSHQKLHRPPGRTMLLIGLSELALPHQCLTGLLPMPFRPRRYFTTRRPPSASFFSIFTRASPVGCLS